MAETASPSPAAIGGYFGLDLPAGDFPHAQGYLLNNGRACIELLLRSATVSCVHVPRYTCDVVLEPIERLGVEVRFYPVTRQLEPRLPHVGQDEAIIVNNYFGLQDDQAGALVDRFGDRLILDCSQALYAPAALSAHTFYTPRKFCGVADGGILVTDRDVRMPTQQGSSWERSLHLLQRIDVGAEAGYPTFQRSDASLTGEPPTRMSPLTRALLSAFDHDAAIRTRRANFQRLHAALASANQLEVPEPERFACPMVYPFLTDAAAVRRRLIANRVFVATYWPNVARWCDEADEEYGLMRDLIPLPIDQRYGAGDMDRILGILA